MLGVVRENGPLECDLNWAKVGIVRRTEESNLRMRRPFLFFDAQYTISDPLFCNYIVTSIRRNNEDSKHNSRGTLGYFKWWNG